MQETVLLKKEKEREERRANLEDLEKDIKKGTKEASTASGKRITAGSGHPRKRRRQQKKTQAGQIKWKKKCMRRIAYDILETWSVTAKAVTKKTVNAARRSVAEGGGRYPKEKGSRYAWKF